ncbi:MAG: DUF4160 domain-containing protein, partial [Bacteroidota bacterium]
PPHFHALYAEFEELIIIASLKTYNGYLPKTQRKKVLLWAQNNQNFIQKRWDELNPKN